MKLTAREIQVVAAIRAGAHGIPEIARALDPPVTPRGAERLIYQLAGKVPNELSPKPLIRVILWVQSV